MKKLLVAPLRLVGIILGIALAVGVAVIAVVLLFLVGEHEGAARLDAGFLRARDAAEWLVVGPARYRRNFARREAKAVLDRQQAERAKVKFVPQPAPYPVPR